ncbi:MAG: hypothetical protein ABEI57_01735 [Halapricum sp.]
MKFDITSSRSVTLLLVALLATSGIVTAVGGSINWSSGPAPNTEYARTETKAVHRMDWGTSDDALRKYEDNSGDVVKMDARINESADNPVSFVPTDVNESDWRLFPHAKEGVSAVSDEGEWSVTGQNASKLAVTDSSTSAGVEALNVATDGSMAAGNTATATFKNFSITSDAEKRYLQLGLDINTIDAGAHVEVRAVDSDGDQRQMGKMDVNGSGDGSLSEIQQVQVVVQDGDFDGDVALLNADKMSPYDIGSQKKDTDGDGKLESVDVTEKKTAGALSLTGLDTLGSTFNDAVIHSISLDMIEHPADQPDENVYVNVNKTDKYPGYDGVATIAVRMQAEDAYDRGISNAVLRDTQSVTSDRVISVEYAEGVPADEAVDEGYLDNRTFSDMTGQYGSEGTEVQLDSSLNQGSAVLLKYKFKLTSDQLSALQNVANGGGGSGAKSSGGLGSIPLIGGALVALLGVLKKLG